MISTLFEILKELISKKGIKKESTTVSVLFFCRSQWRFSHRLLEDTREELFGFQWSPS